MTNKIFKNLKLGLVGIVLAGSFNGCDNFNTTHKEISGKNFPITKQEIQSDPHKEALKKYTPLTKWQKDSLFYNLNPGLKEGINKIYIIDKKDFFDSSVKGHAHQDGRILCLGEGYSNETLFHESAHIRHFYLEEIESDFSKKWEEIANFEYEKGSNINTVKSEKEALILQWTNFPKNGCLNPYFTTDKYEDVAYFTVPLDYNSTPKEVKNQCFGRYLFPLYFADTTDHRYKQKLDLLREYNFLTSEEHEKLSKNLGSLNYLLKK